MNAATRNKFERRQNHNYGRGRGRGKRLNNYGHHKSNKQENNKSSQNNSLKSKDNMYHRCGMEGHWARV